jgi:hypothetical protein
MHIELTDHLRCPQNHPEAFLVLLPDRMNHRDVVAGHLGCPICGWSTAWQTGIPDFGGAAGGVGSPPFDAAAVHAMLGTEGAGGWVAVAGNAGALAHELAGELPGVGIIAINPPETVAPGAGVDLLLGGVWPIKTHALRGVVLGTDAASYRDVALASVLPGLRMIGTGPAPTEGCTLMAAAEGVWVVRKA